MKRPLLALIATAALFAPSNAATLSDSTDQWVYEVDDAIFVSLEMLRAARPETCWARISLAAMLSWASKCTVPVSGLTCLTDDFDNGSNACELYDADGDCGFWSTHIDGHDIDVFRATLGEPLVTLQTGASAELQPITGSGGTETGRLRTAEAGSMAAACRQDRLDEGFR